MNPALIIARKRDGHTLTAEEIAGFVGGFARGEVPDYQMAAMAMAIYLQGMEPGETAALTECMLRSGTTLGWTEGGPPKVDKHSTGGVGDKVSLVLAPLLVCCGLQVPMISGRGLGATGGTLDKLESIPGFRTDLSIDEIRDITERVGCVITGATADIAPADKRLYALRDVTATVASIPLITASIMSKKLAENLDSLVLDVKFGSGAFMKSIDQARELARSLVDTGKRMGVKTAALLTDMNQPLGRMAGNAVEVDESVATLSGNGPEDLTQLTLALGRELLLLTGHTTTAENAEQLLTDHIASGRALEKFREMVAAQGGNLDAPRPIVPASDCTAPRSGFVASIDTEKLGLAVIELGGGRRVMTDKIDHSVGLEMQARIGDQVRRGAPLVRIFARLGGVARVHELLRDAIIISDKLPASLQLIAERVT